MGLSHIRPASLLILLVLVLVLFGGKRLRNLGDDLAAAVKSFRRAFSDQSNEPPGSN